MKRNLIEAISKNRSMHELYPVQEYGIKASHLYSVDVLAQGVEDFASRDVIALSRSCGEELMNSYFAVGNYSLKTIITFDY
jgi:hypothetical protein